MKQVDTMTHLKSQNNLNSTNLFSIRRNKLVNCLFCLPQNVVVLKDINLVKRKKCAVVNSTAYVCLRATNLCGKLQRRSTWYYRAVQMKISRKPRTVLAFLSVVHIFSTLPSERWVNDGGEGSSTGVYFKEIDKWGQCCWMKMFLCEEFSYQMLLHIENKTIGRYLLKKNTSCFQEWSLSAPVKDVAVS